MYNENKSYKKIPSPVMEDEQYEVKEKESRPELVKMEDNISREISILRESRSIIFELITKLDYLKEDGQEEGDDLKKANPSLETHYGRLYDLNEQLKNENYYFKSAIRHLRDLV